MYLDFNYNRFTFEEIQFGRIQMEGINHDVYKLLELYCNRINLTWLKLLMDGQGPVVVNKLKSRCHYTV